MTTLVATEALHLSMSGEQKKRRTSKRLAAAADLEQDDDFQFVRMSKRPKREEKESSTKTTTKTMTTTTKRGGGGRKLKKTKAKTVRDGDSSDVMDQPRRSLRKRTSGDASVVVAAAAAKKKKKKMTTTKTTRTMTDDGMVEEEESEESEEESEEKEEEEEEEDLRPVRRGTRRSLRLSGGGGEGKTVGRGGGDEVQIPTRRASRSGNEEKTCRVGNDDKTSRVGNEDKVQIKKSTKKTKKRGNNNNKNNDEPVAQQPPSPTTIALPMSDTPVINRNKEMRRKGQSNRRSSLGSRGRRASSLIDNGQAAMPHREVDSTEFYKHISADGLPEPRRMKQLLMWCGERALSEKPPHGRADSHAILGARAIQDQLLKDFASKSEFSDWFSREEDEAKGRQVVLKPNPRNAELDEKMAALEAKIARLREEKKAWLQMGNKPPPEQARLSFSDEATAADLELLDADDRAIGLLLGDEEESFTAARRRTEDQLREMDESMRLQVDQLADSVHKLEQRVVVADDEAAEVLRLGAVRLKEREERERERAGTREEGTVGKVLRSLSRILPRGGDVDGDGGG